MGEVTLENLLTWGTDTQVTAIGGEVVQGLADSTFTIANIGIDIVLTYLALIVSVLVMVWIWSKARGKLGRGVF